MTDEEATTMSKCLLATYGNREFELSMPDQTSYELMRKAFAALGRTTGPDGEFFVIKVLPGGVSKDA